MKSLKNKNFLILLAGGLFVLLVAVILSNKQISPARNQTTATLTEKEYPVDTENDGVYTNYKYGFRFEYPEDIFIKYIPRKNKNSILQAEFNDNSEGGYPDMFSLVVSARADDEGKEVFKKFQSLPIGVYESTDEDAAKYFNNRKKLRDVDIGKFKGVLLYSKFVGSDTEPYHGHVLIFEKDNIVISIGIQSPPGPNLADELENERLGILDNIIDTLEIID